ncbi:MAG: alkaline phosphatase [Duncaniella sp.]|nr:alkaline phosphatase [Duncaniella sp.]
MRLRLKSLALAMSAAAGLSAAEAPKYIFYFIGDGMGMAHAMAAEAYNRTVLKNDKPILMMQFPVASAATTYSASSPVTDSAAAGTALSTGHKTRNGMLGMDADTVSVTSVAKELFDRSYGVALVTSVPPDDATPGAFYAHVPSRKMYYEIGRQAAESGYDFIAGSNLRGLKDKEGNPTDLAELFKANNVTVARGLGEAAGAPAGRVVLLNPAEIDYHQIHFTIDSVKGAMNLPDMTAAALTQLERNGRDRFFMMVEGGNIDYAGHANDGGAAIKEVLNFNQALRHAYDWYLAHPDETLILVTADHETGGMGLGNNSVGYDLHLEYIDGQRVSKDAFANHCRAMAKSRRIYEWEDMKEYLRDNFGFWSGVPVSEAQEKKLSDDFNACFKEGTGKEKKTLYNSFSAFTEDVFRVMDSATGLGWTTNGHSGGLVPVYAVGVGSELFAPLNDNTQLPAKLRKIAGLE